MKSNHEQVEMFIRQAIKACSYDNSLSATKSHLNIALQLAIAEGNKRVKKENAKKVAKTKHQEWWDMIKKNATAGELDWLSEEEDV